jgi:uncharacterized membrane protein
MNTRWLKSIASVALSVVLIFLFTVLSPQAVAQGAKTKSNAPGGPSRHLSVIVFAGVAGAVLGLSTLSFYGRPQDKLTHIAIGAAIGIIGGAIYTTFKAATDPKDFYGLREQGPNPEFWNLALDSRQRPEGYVPKASMTFEF